MEEKQQEKKAKVVLVPCDTYEEETVYRAMKCGMDALGGIREFVNPEEKILVKPNFVLASPPEAAATTHPSVMKGMFRLLQEAGCTQVLYGDSPGHGSCTAAAGKLGMEKEETHLMDRKPRSSSEGIFAQGLGFNVVYQGIFVTLLTLAAFFIGERLETGRWVFANITDCQEGMTMAFLTMSMCEIFHSFNMRSATESIFTLLRQGNHNWILVGTMVASLVLTTCLIEVPFLADAFGFTPISYVEYGISLLLAISIIPLVEIIKYIQRKKVSAN